MSPLKSPSIPTAAQAIATIARWENVSLERRKALATAVRMYCRLIGKPPETARLDPAHCLPAMDGASPAALEVLPQTLRNMRSALRETLRRLALLAPVRHRVPVSDPAWADLIGQLPARFHPHRLRAFMEYCASLGIVPEAVTNETLAAYLAHRIATRGSTNQRSDVREAARQWNKMRAVIPSWPPIELALRPIEGQYRALPFSAYPQSLQDDVQRFREWCVRDPSDNLSGDEDERDPLSVETVNGRCKGLRLLLHGLVETGSPPETLDRLSVLIQPDIARRTLVWHRTRLHKAKPPSSTAPSKAKPTSSTTPSADDKAKPTNSKVPSADDKAKATGSTAFLADALQVLAHHIGLAGPELAHFKRILKGVRPKKQKEIPDRLADLLDLLNDPVVEAKLLHLPVVLMRQARRLRDGWTTPKGVNHPPKTMDACWLAALAAAIEIELHLPIRVHDLAHLKLQEELSIIPRGRRASEARLRVHAHKNDMVVETAFGQASTQLILEYVRDFRPLGPHPETSWVFPHRDRADQPRAKNHFSEAITDAVKAHTDVRVNVHAFRAFVAMLILEDNPHAIEDVRAILGHSSFEMAFKHYRRNGRLGAAQRVRDGIAKRRSQSKLTTVAARLPMDLASRSGSFRPRSFR